MRTVVHLVSRDPDERRTALALVENLVADDTGRVEAVAVVAQAGGIGAVRPDAETAETVRGLLDRGVAVKVCENTLEMMNLDHTNLVEGIELVPEGTVEVSRLQTEGWAYVRP